MLPIGYILRSASRSSAAMGYRVAPMDLLLSLRGMAAAAPAAATQLPPSPTSVSTLHHQSFAGTSIAIGSRLFSYSQDQKQHVSHSSVRGMATGAASSSSSAAAAKPSRSTSSGGGGGAQGGGVQDGADANRVKVVLLKV